MTAETTFAVIALIIATFGRFAVTQLMIKRGENLIDKRIREKGYKLDSIKTKKTFFKLLTFEVTYRSSEDTLEKRKCIVINRDIWFRE